MHQPIARAHGNQRVFIACLLSFMILMTPIASLGAATLRATAPDPKAVTNQPTAREAASDKLLSALEAALFEPASALPPVPVVTATKTDSFPVHPSGQAQPGDQITYDIAINNASTDATNTIFTDTIDPNTTLAPGSLKVSPVAAADSYVAEQSVALSVGAPGVLTNDYGTPAPTVGGIVGCLDVTAPFTCTTTGGGTVVLAADGSFTYTPLGVFTGPDTFIYTSTNSAAGGLAPDDTATVTITVDARPTVTSTTPTNGATGVATSPNIVVNFSEPVTASTSSFTIECPAPGNLQTFTVSGSGTSTITLDPTGDLPAATTCTVTVIANQISDVDSNDPPDNMAADFTFSFTTDAPPTVTSTTPTNGASGIATNSNIVINFSEPVTATTSSFTIECPAPGNLKTYTVSGSGTSTITLDPTVDLPNATLCTVTVIASQIADTDTNDPPNNMTASYVFSFTTDAAPSVTSTVPTDTATGVPTNSNITINFSEPVNATIASFSLECPVTVPKTFTVSGSGTSTITLDPTVDLPIGTICRVTVIANQISDTDTADPPDNMAANYVFNFTTDFAPTVSSTVPTNGATTVATNTNITINFSEPVSATTSSFTIECPNPGNLQTFAVSGSGTSTITLDPTADLPVGTICTVTVIANQISDTDTNDPPDNMVANFVFSFTTDFPPSVSTTTPTNGATGVAANTNITINFSEAVTATTSSFTIECPTPGNLQAFAVSGSGTSAIVLNPTADLPPGTICTVTVIAAQISDTDAGDPPDNMAANYVFSFSVPPVAVNDSYAPSILGNVGINTDNSTEFTVLTNDTPNTGVTINQSGSSTQGGTVVVAADGKFTYTPPAGYEGADTFTYTISNAAGTSNSATVSFTVAGMIWFINAAAGAGDGRLATPFSSVASFQAINDNGGGTHPGNGDNIFIYENASAYTGPITLLSNQKLIGQDATATLAAISGVSVPADSFPLPVMNTGAPATTLNNAVAASNAVNLNAAGTSNTVRGLTLTTGSATSKGLNGTTFGTLNVADLIISGSGPALDLTTGTLSGSFNSISSTGGANGVRLSAINSGATISFGTGALSGASAEEFLITSGGTVALTYDGTISTTAAGSRPVSITGKTVGGNVTFNGAVSAGTSSSGVNLDNNDVATVTFRGGLALTTTVNTAFNAINGGTIEVCDENPCNAAATGALVNTLTTTTGIALNVNATTISANKLEFRSIFAGTGAAGPSTSGIILNNTGSLGGLKISGNGGSCTSAATCTGGAIQDTGGSGISLTNTQKVTIDRIFIQDTVKSGISGTTVVDFTLTNSTIDNSGNTTGNDFSNLGFGFDSLTTENNLSGVVVITGNTLTDAWMNGIDIQNFAGTISDATISNNTITSTTSSVTSHGSGIRLLGFGHAGGTSNITKATITGNTITNFPGGAGITAQYGNITAGPAGVWGTVGSATNRIFIQSNIIRGESAANPMNTNAILMTLTGKGQANWLADSNGTVANPIANIGGTEIGVTVRGANPTATCDITNNRIVGITNVAAQAIAFAADFSTLTTDAPQLSGTISGNNISGQDGEAIQALATPGSTAHVDVSIKNNVTTAPNCGGCNRYGITAQVGTSSGTVTGAPSMCLDMSGNTAAGSGVNTGIGIRKRTAAYVFNIENFVGGGDPTAFLTGLNPAGGGVTMISQTTGFGNCATAPLRFAPGGVMPYDAELSTSFNPSQFMGVSDAISANGLDVTSWRGATASFRSISHSLSQQQLDLVVSAAIERWSATGLTEQQVAALHTLKFEISDLQGTYLGEAKGNRILVDRNAESKGWFVDPSPLSDASFGTSASASRFYTDPFDVPAGHVDLLTAVMHEIGHKLGLSDSYEEKDRDNLMYGHLTVGERRLPAPGQASSAKPGTLKGRHFLSIATGEKERPVVTKSTRAKSAKVATTTAPVLNPTCGVGTIAICLGTLKAGKTVNIQFKVTINTPFPSNQVSNQGSVAFDGGGPVLTDDPSVGGAADPTVTPVQTCTPPPANMVAWWTGDDTTRDIAGGHDGTFVDPDGVPDPDYAPGKVGQAFDFDGVNDYVDIPDSPSLNPTTAITVDAWIRVASITGAADSNIIVNKDDGGAAGGGAGRDYLLQVFGNEIQFVVFGTNGTAVATTSSAPISVNTWYHVAGTYDGAFIRVYVNGAPLATTAATNNLRDSNTPLGIGQTNDISIPDRRFNGLVDEVEIFDRVLTQPEIQALFDADAGGKCKPSDLKITKTHTDPFVQGSTGNTYSITVHNDGPGTTSGVVSVLDNLPLGLTATAWSGTGWVCNPLPPGGQAGPAALVCSRSNPLGSGDSYDPITLTVSVATDAPPTVTNTATVTGGDMDESDNTASDQTNITLIPKLAVTKTEDSAAVSAGSPIGFTIVVSNSNAANTGTAIATTLSDPLPAGTGINWSISPAYSGPGTCNIIGAVGSQVLNCSFGDMASGASATVHISSETTFASCGIYTNEATVAATNHAAVVSTTASTTVQCPSLTVAKTEDAVTVNAGETMGFNIVVSNSSGAGTGTATAVTLSDPLPAGPGVNWSINPTYAGPGTCAITGAVGSQVLGCSFGDMAPGASITIEVESSTAFGSCGDYANTAKASSTNHPDVEDGATTTVECPALTMTKTEGEAMVNTGSPIAFTIQVDNSNAAGTGTAKNVELNDPLPSGPGVNWSIDPTYTGPGTCAITGAVGSQVLECSFGDMAAGGSSTVVVVSNTSSESCGSYANTATLSADNHPNAPALATTSVQCPDLTVTKTADSFGVQPGNDIGFTITVQNSSAAGIVTATAVTLEDPLPAGPGVSWSLTPGYSGVCTIDPPGQTLNCSFGDLDPGETATVHVTSSTTEASCGTYPNTATASSTNHPDVQASASTDVLCGVLVVVGSSGIVDEEAMSIYEVRNQFATIKTGVNSGTVIYRYQLPATAVFVDSLAPTLNFRIRYRDSGAASRVQVLLKAANLSGDGRETLYAFDSDGVDSGGVASPANGQFNQTVDRSFTVPGPHIRHGSYGYYLEVIVTKTGPNAIDPGFIGCAISEGPITP